MGVSREFENQIDDAANSMPSVLASNFGTCFSRFDCIIQPLVTKKKKVTPYPAGERGRVWWHKIEAILRLGGWARVLVLKNITVFLVLLGLSQAFCTDHQ